MKKRKIINYKSFIHLFFIIYSLLCIVPFWLIVSISLSKESDIMVKGFSIIPENFTTEAYSYVFNDASTLWQAYIVTAIYAVLGTIISVVVMAMFGYALSRQHYVLKKFLIFYTLITMLFNGGLVPSYVINTQIFGLQNNIAIYLVTGMVTGYTVFVFRTFFAQIPTSLIEAASIDGAKELQILTKIIVPLSKPVLATFTFTGVVQRWNDFETSMYYIQDQKLYTLQYLLQNILNEAAFLNQLKNQLSAFSDMIVVPSETLKYAMCVLAAGPMVIIPALPEILLKGYGCRCGKGLIL